MSNNYTTLNPGTGGDAMDEEGVAFTNAPTLRKRPRVVIGGNANDGADVVIPTTADPPASGTYALPVRQVGKNSARLIDANSLALDVLDGGAVPSGTRGLLLMAQDSGGVARRVRTSTSGVFCNALTDAQGTLGVSVSPFQHLRVSGFGSSIFRDAFDGSVVDTNRWTSSASGQGTVTQSSGQLSLSISSSANSYAVVGSVPGFSPISTPVRLDMLVKFEGGSGV